MILKLQRIGNGNDSTLGLLSVDGDFGMFTLEDQKQEKKVMHETRIPKGKYEVKFREEPTPMTNRYRQKYDWFNWHLEIQNVKNFSGVYIHVGNTDDHTSGCVLVGYQGWNLSNGEYEIHRSADAFRDLYTKVKQHLRSGERVWIEISD